MNKYSLKFRIFNESYEIKMIIILIGICIILNGAFIYSPFWPVKWGINLPRHNIVKSLAVSLRRNKNTIQKLSKYWELQNRFERDHFPPFSLSVFIIIIKQSVLSLKPPAWSKVLNGFKISYVAIRDCCALQLVMAFIAIAWLGDRL